MTQEKMRKLIAACAVAATTLLVFLFGVLIYQWITIAVYNKRIEKETADVVYWTEQNENATDDLEYYNSDYYKFLESLELKALEEKDK